MKQQIFREFSIRGHADQDLPDDVVARIGRAAGTFFLNCDANTLVVGHDVRLSSPRIKRALLSGLSSTGCTVFDIGLAPTPTFYFAVDYLNAGGGIMITASHNPLQDNGFKLRAAETLTGPALQSIYRLADRGDFAQGYGAIQTVTIFPAYLSALQSHVEPGRSLKIVVDGGNSANGPLVVDFLRRQGHTVFPVFIEPDGAFPNRSPDPTGPGVLATASQAVINAGADCGLAFDGDGDRVVLLDDAGAVHLGDTILTLLARAAAKNGPVTVVCDVSCTQALADDVRNHHGQTVSAPVGYAFVHQTMRKIGASLGGEASGHLFCLDEQFRFDDAILAAIKLTNFIAGLNQPLSQVIAGLPRYYTTPNERIACPDNRKTAVIARLTRHFQANYPVDTTDGARIDFGRGWVLIRQSNTQPAITLRAEADSQAEMERIRALVLDELHRMANGK